MPKDKFGRDLRVGDNVLRAYRASTQAHLELRTVDRIDGDKVWLNGAKGSQYISNFSCIVRLPGYFAELLKSYHA